jgi:hypothetical protein
MADLKTVPNDQSVQAFLNQVEDDTRRQDCLALLRLMQEVTGQPPVMWGDSIIGFGRYQYHYASGRSGEWFWVGFSPRKQALTLYISAGFDHFPSLMERLGKYTTGKSCLYVKKLADIHLDTLRELIKQSTEHMIKTNPL